MQGCTVRTEATWELCGFVVQPGAAPANDGNQLAGALHGQPARRDERRISDFRETQRGSP